MTFDQTEFGASPNVSLSPTGSVFVPKSCAQGRTCGFVLALHGCKQQAAHDPTDESPPTLRHALRPPGATEDYFAASTRFALSTLIGSTGTSSCMPRRPVLTLAIASITDMPSLTQPNTA